MYVFSQAQKLFPGNSNDNNHEICTSWGQKVTLVTLFNNITVQFMSDFDSISVRFRALVEASLNGTLAHAISVQWEER